MRHSIFLKISDKVRSILSSRRKFDSERFFQEKGSYLMNGISLSEALHLSEHHWDMELREYILSGMRLSEAMKSLNVFSGREITLIRLAEETGNLAGAFESIHVSLREQRELTSRIRTVMIYPMMLLCTAYLFLVCTIYFIVPPLSEMLKELGAENGLLRTIHSLSVYIPIQGVLLFSVLLGFYLIRILKHRDKIFQLVLGTKTARYKEMMFIEELSLLSKGGLDLVESLQVLLEEGYPCEELLNGIQNGTGLAESFRKDRFSPGLVRYLIMAEETGNYTEAFTSFVSLQKLYFRDYLKRKTALMEPLAIAVMGMLVFFVAYLVMIPMLDAYEGL